MSTSAPSPKNALIVWWVIWFAMVNGLVLQRLFIGAAHSAEFSPIAVVAFGPMLVSALIRIALLPRLTTKARALPFFIVGLASAEAGGLLGLFLGGEKADVFIAISFGLLLSYAPFFAGRYNSGTAAGSPFRQ